MTKDNDEPDTPEAALEAVDKAIQHWVSVRNSDALLTGWVLHYATTTFETDGDPLYQVRYCCGPSTDLVRAVGTSDLGHRTMLDDVLSDPTDPEDRP